jgi:hypothetical protein
VAQLGQRTCFGSRRSWVQIPPSRPRIALAQASGLSPAGLVPRHAELTGAILACGDA